MSKESYSSLEFTISSDDKSSYKTCDRQLSGEAFSNKNLAPPQHDRLPRLSSLANIGDVKGEQFKSKPDVLDEVLRVLRRILEYTICCLTCGCYRAPSDPLHGEFYEAELMEEERTAVQNLLKYLDSGESKEPTINEERLKALCVLTYSDNQDLQRSAALCFTELSERMRTSVSEIVLEPLVVLLKSRDTQVQRTASLALSNFALNGPESNKRSILHSGAVKPLIQLLQSDNLEVQCNTCGCITTLATDDQSKQEIVSSGGVRPLLTLAKSPDIRVQRNATGALLNLTHLQSNRNDLVAKGAVPVLVDVLHSSDPDVQYYCAAALSNLAVNERHRAMMVAIGYNDIIKRLIKLLGSSRERVKCQACLALRNLASDTDNQLLVVKLGGLPPLHGVMKHSKGDTLSAAVACLRNLSIHKQNETDIIRTTFLSELSLIVMDSGNVSAQIHSAGTIRNLAAGEQIQAITSSGCVESLLEVMLNPATRETVLVEASAALAVLADDDDTRELILNCHHGEAFHHLVKMADSGLSTDIRYNCAGVVGQLAVAELSAELLKVNIPGLLSYLDDFLQSSDPSLVHIALWTIVQLLKCDVFTEEFNLSTLSGRVQHISNTSGSEAITELANTVLEYTSD